MELGGVTAVSNEICTWVEYSRKRSPCSEANNSQAGQEIPRLLWNPEAHYSLPLQTKLDENLIT
jgi:hypothetical protein